MIMIFDFDRHLAVANVTYCKYSYLSTEKERLDLLGYFHFCINIYSNQSRTAVTKSTQPVGSVCRAATKHVQTDSSKRLYAFFFFPPL